MESLIAEALKTGRIAGLPSGHFIDGAFRPSASGAMMADDDPGTARPFHDFAAGDAQDVEAAVAAARRAFDPWRRTAPRERVAILLRMAALMRENADRLAIADCLDSGKTIGESAGDVASSARMFEYYAGAADKLHGDTIPLGADYLCMTTPEPVGVTAHIIPWNYPTSTFARGVAPAIAVGCTVVAKPAETTPLTALMMADLLHQAGLPAGVCNVVTGTGKAAGEPLAVHPGVDHVTFTGSVATGLRVGALATGRAASTVLELGGKSPILALADCDIDRLITDALWAICSNAGQVCSAGSRLVIERAIHAQVVEGLAAQMAALKIGHGLMRPDMGAINSALQLGRVSGHVESARDRGLEVATGGRVVETQQGGWHYAPTIIDDCPSDDPIVQQEVFGPVIAVQVVDSLEEGIIAANCTEFGLWSCVHTSDVTKALRAARDIRAGQVTVNDYWAGGTEVPFGGFGKSGLGREKGLEALLGYCRTKAITMRM